MTRREREQAQRVTLGVAAALVLAAIIVVGGLAVQYLVVPGSAVAVVDDERLSTRDFWNRVELEEAQAIGQLANLIQFQQQIDPTGEQGFFTAQIQQLQGSLSNLNGFSDQVLEQMIDEMIIRQAAEEAGVSVSEEEIDAEVETQIARQLGAVTAPEATATSEAFAAATATAEVSTPTPTLTPSPTPTNTVASTATVVPTLEPQPTPTLDILTQEEFQGAYQEQIASIRNTSGLSEAQYRQLVAVDLLRPKLIKAIGEQMPTAGERVRASHILISVATDADDATQQAALARAISITQRLRDGEDFATLAEQYSDDPGSAQRGGDLGFFGRGQMVAPFEEAAFSLEIGEISDPVRSDFGYHIIRAEERDQGEPDFDGWLQARKAEASVERRLTDSRMPTLPTPPPQLLTTSAVTLPTPAPITVP